MMKSFRIGSLFGIPIKLDLTFLLILPVFAYLIGFQIEPVIELLNVTMNAGIDVGALTAEWWLPYLVGLAAAIGLFVGVLFHELGHSVTAQRYGFPIDSITLWLLGGIAALSEMPEDWKQEFNIAIAGPIVSVLVGVVSYALFLVTPEAFDGARFVLGYLAVLNVALAIFNMVPAFPMDGGRILRALLARSQPYAQATQQAASIGKMFAFIMGLFGLFAFNIILIAVAFFVYIAASSEAQQVTMKAAFQDVTVSDIMTPARDLHTVEPGTSVTELVQRMFTERHTGYPVVDRDAWSDGELIGLVTLEDAREIDPVERDAYVVEDVMTTDLETISPDSDAMTAIERMQQSGIGRLLVVEDDDLVGLISRTDLMTAFDIVQQSGGAVGRRDQVQPVGSMD
ncbi:CBS domain-containing protein [Natronobacterium gregoryi]|uniref:Zinc metalloprotease n=2 Tax=Natronobacterium gregoryi TaxID=44930 RepID=L0AG16_NATGS|nr:CBS domain-containing protein [Natronobacterium gregoryi]AFZ72868.1 Zn-dependent protease [Natronobacterium gregoryi SP2]ELY69642.1 peptidase M50 [Natronobacterium gregoryi SP2]PLK21903.1 CBS domain-containing protein [Natronobacterium gregoryi SP2]SFI66056.1 Zn-dependent protease (includes SpoIVFB) [Natronobacterium gregoryi]